MQTCNEELTNLTDRELVALAKQGSRDAFGELILRNGRRCLRVAVSILRNTAEAEEGCQNGYCKAYSRLEQFQGDSEFSTWLLRIIENECLMLIRRQKRANFVYIDDVATDRDNDKVQVRTTAADPEHEFGQQEILRAMHIEINRIPPLLRQMLLLRDLGELSMNDLAVRLGISVPAAKSRLLRARVELRQRMQRHYPSRVTQIPAPRGQHMARAN